MSVIERAKSLLEIKTQTHLVVKHNPRPSDAGLVTPGKTYKIHSVGTNGETYLITRDDGKPHWLQSGSVSHWPKVKESVQESLDDIKVIATTRRLYPKRMLSLIESSPAYVDGTPAINSVSRTQELVQYVNYGNDFSPRGEVKLVKALEAGIYEVQETMGGVQFSKKDIRSDELLRFEDSRYNKIIEEVGKFWEMYDRFNQHGFTHKRGIILYGNPGTGKSCILKQIMDEAVSAGNVVFVCKSPYALLKGVKTFREIEEKRNALVILEDVDDLCQYGEHSILQLFDGDNQVDRVLYLATTNYIDRLPPRILRVGRFDTKMEVLNPPANGRRAYFRHKLPTESDTRIEDLVTATEDYSFAELREFLISVYCYGNSIESTMNKVKLGITESEEMDESSQLDRYNRKAYKRKVAGAPGAQPIQDLEDLNNRSYLQKVNPSDRTKKFGHLGKKVILRPKESNEVEEMLLDENLAQWHNVLKKHGYKSQDGYNSISPKGAEFSNGKKIGPSASMYYRHANGDMASLSHQRGVTVVSHTRINTNSSVSARVGQQRASTELKDPGDLDKYLHSVHRSNKEAAEFTELSKGTLGSYVKKAYDQFGDIKSDIQDVIHYGKGLDSDEYKKLSSMRKKKRKGIELAVDKLVKKKESVSELIERAKGLLGVSESEVLDEINLPSFHGFKVGDLVKINMKHSSIDSFKHQTYGSYGKGNYGDSGYKPPIQAQQHVQLGVVLGKDEKDNHLQVAFHQHGIGGQNFSQRVHKDALTKVDK